MYGCIDFTAYLYELFGLEYRFELSTRPEDHLGTDEEWDFTEDALRSALDRRGLVYELNEGDGAFYGPKIDLHMTDVARAVVADGHRPTRCADAAAVRSHLHGRRQHGAHAVRDPPCELRLARTVHRHPDRALRAATSRCGSRRCRCGSSRSARRTAAPLRSSRRGWGRPAHGSRSTTATRPIGRRIRDAELEKIPRVVVYGDRESADALAVRERGGRAGRRSRWTNSWPNWYTVSLLKQGHPFLTSPA